MSGTAKDRQYHPERACGKWKYRNRAIAERLRKRLAAQGEQVFVYGCSGCGFWHISSSKTARAK